MSKEKLTREQFLSRAEEIHKNCYDYSKAIYNGMHKKVKIKCNKCNEYFYITPKEHLYRKRGCPYCCGKKYNTKKFVIKAKKIHEDSYDFSKVVYKGTNYPITITCPIHGDFTTTPNRVLRGSGCSKCAGNHHYSTEEWIKESIRIHGDRYDYSKSKYINRDTNICIICKKCKRELWLSPREHLRYNQGCSYCYGSRYDINKFIEKSRNVHGNKYDYSKVDLDKRDEKGRVCIICPEHGEFWQRIDGHLKGKGCTTCNASHLENEIRLFLEEYGILYEEQKKFSWLYFKKFLKLDFYLPDYNIAIECQGLQHFEPVDFSYRNIEKERIENEFKLLQKRDTIKYNLCKENNIQVLYYSNIDIIFPYDVITDKKVLLTKIIQNGKN